jgi:hypothetical protein
MLPSKPLALLSIFFGLTTAFTTPVDAEEGTYIAYMDDNGDEVHINNESGKERRVSPRPGVTLDKRQRDFWGGGGAGNENEWYCGCGSVSSFLGLKYWLIRLMLATIRLSMDAGNCDRAVEALKGQVGLDPPLTRSVSLIWCRFIAANPRARCHLGSQGTSFLRHRG